MSAVLSLLALSAEALAFQPEAVERLGRTRVCPACDLSGADLRQADNLSQFQLNRACGDETTQPPKWLFVRHCE